MGTAVAQQGEIGASIGYGFYRDARVNSANGEASVGIHNRFTAGAVVCEDLYRYLSGEVRYIYQDGDPFLKSDGKRGNIQGQSHAIHYDLLFHIRERDSRLRPFAAVGVGGKYYRTTGPAPSPQPAPEIAQLVHANEWKFLVDVGFGVKYRLTRNVILRGDFRDYITPFPKRLFLPNGNGTDRGLFQQFTPMFGLSYTF